MKTKSIILMLALCVLFVPSLMAQEGEGVTHANTLSTTIAQYDSLGAVELKTDYNHIVTIPFGGTGMLTSGNNMQIKAGIGLSPVAVTPHFDIVVTPVAVLQFMAGAEIGSGWYLSPLNLNGVGTADYTTVEDEEDGYIPVNYTKNAFSALKWKIKAGGAFQFDTGAIIPGDWSHVLIRTYHEVYYQALTTAANDQFWEYEIGKENLNGAKYYSNYLLGYSLPAVPVLDLVGLLFEAEQMVTHKAASPITDGDWASDLWDYKIAGLFNFKFNDSHGLACLVQFHTTPNWEELDDDTLALSDENDFGDKELDDLTAADVARPLRDINTAGVYSWKFYRVAFVYTWTF